MVGRAGLAGRWVGLVFVCRKVGGAGLAKGAWSEFNVQSAVSSPASVKWAMSLVTSQQSCFSEVNSMCLAVVNFQWLHNYGEVGKARSEFSLSLANYIYYGEMHSSALWEGSSECSMSSKQATMRVAELVVSSKQ